MKQSPLLIIAVLSAFAFRSNAQESDTNDNSQLTYWVTAGLGTSYFGPTQYGGASISYAPSMICS
ncbi:MAG TPA: hypothetical protein VGA55_04685 [Bacteroidota bacterium]